MMAFISFRPYFTPFQELPAGAQKSGCYAANFIDISFFYVKITARWFKTIPVYLRDIYHQSSYLFSAILNLKSLEFKYIQASRILIRQGESLWHQASSF